MLTEIYCETFGEDKRILFSPGLNVIQGLEGNSIGKSSVLKIIDYAFGGRYYAESNDDILKHVGNHDICFTHTFEGVDYFFRRNAKKHSKVYCCYDNQAYLPKREMSETTFCKWLLEKYGFNDYHLTLREMIGLYIRVWNKPNKEVNRPLYNHNSQSLKEAIISLIKIFNEYDPIAESNEYDTYLKTRSQVLNKAVKYNLIKLPSKKQYDAIIVEIEEIDKKITQLRRNIAISSVDNAEDLSNEINILLEQREFLLEQHGRTSRALGRCLKNTQKLRPLDNSTFSSLTEYFPNVNLQRLNEVQGFHESLQKVLLDELHTEEMRLRKHLEELSKAIQENESAIQEQTKLPTRAVDAMNMLLQLSKRKEQLESQVELYDDKVADTIRKEENKASLDQLLTQITTKIAEKINAKIKEYSNYITTSNSKAPTLHLSGDQYQYGVEDNTGTGKAYTDLILFDLAILALTELPILVHDSFLLNNIDDRTKQSFLKLYSQFSNKQVFISLDTYLGNDSKEIDDLLYSSTRLILSENKTLFGKDWRT